MHGSDEMDKVLTFLARLIALALAALFILTAILSFLFSTLGRQLFNADLYKRALVDQRLYERLPGLIAEMVTSTALSDSPVGMPPFIASLKASDWEGLIRTLLPPADLKAMTEDTLDQVFAFLRGESDTATISLVQLKARLSSQAGVDAVMDLLRAQPACTAEQVIQLGAAALGGQGEIVLCSPPEYILELVAPMIQALLEQTAASLPDQAIVLKPGFGGSASQPGPLGNDPVRTLRTVRLILGLSPLLPLGLLLLIALFAVRSIKGWMRWWGIPIFLAGLACLGLGLILIPAFDLAWALFVVARIPAYLPADIADLGRELVRAVLGGLAGSIIPGAALLTLPGLAAWIGSYFIKARQELAAPEHTPTE
jgi:hypothetical protein